MSRDDGVAWPFDALGLDAETDDRKVVKRAYAKALKQLDQEVDKDGFQSLREAYEYALQVCEGSAPPVGAMPAVHEATGWDALLEANDEAGMQLSESDADHLAAQWRLVECISEPSIVEDDETRIRRILWKLDLSDPDIRLEAESQIMQWLDDNIQTNAYGSFFAKGIISRSFAKECSDTFGWMDDVIGWQNRVWVEPQFILAVDNVLNAQEEEIHNDVQAFYDLLFTPKVWGPWALATIIAINVLNRSDGMWEKFSPGEHFLYVKLPFFVVLSLPALTLGMSLIGVLGGVLIYGARAVLWMRRLFSQSTK